MKSFSFQNRLNCEDADLNYVAFVSALFGFLTQSLQTLDKDEFSKGFVEFFPSESNLSLDMVSEECFYGTHAGELSFVYSQLVDLWCQLQEENMSQERFKEWLQVQKDKLEPLVKSL